MVWRARSFPMIGGCVRFSALHLLFLITKIMQENLIKYVEHFKQYHLHILTTDSTGKKNRCHTVDHHQVTESPFGCTETADLRMLHFAANDRKATITTHHSLYISTLMHCIALENCSSHRFGPFPMILMRRTQQPPQF